MYFAFDLRANHHPSIINHNGLIRQKEKAKYILITPTILFINPQISL